MATEYILNKLEEQQHRIDALEKHLATVYNKVFPQPSKKDDER